MLALDQENRNNFESLFPVTKTAPLVAYPKRSKLFNEGDRAENLFIVKSGIVRHFMISPAGGNFNLFFVSGNRPHLLGIETLARTDQSAVGDERYYSEAEAATSVVAQIIPKFVIQEKMYGSGHSQEERQAFALAVSLSLAETIRDRLRRQSTIHKGDFAEKFRVSLLDIANELNPQNSYNEPQRIQGLTQSDIAEFIGGSRVGFNNLLKNWVAKGLLVQDGRAIIIPNPLLIKNMHSKPFGPSFKQLARLKLKKS